MLCGGVKREAPSLCGSASEPKGPGKSFTLNPGVDLEEGLRRATAVKQKRTHGNTGPVDNPLGGGAEGGGREEGQKQLAGMYASH